MIISIWARAWGWIRGLFGEKEKGKPDPPDITPGIAEVEVGNKASDEIMALAAKHKVPWKKMLDRFNKGVQIEKEMGVGLREVYSLVMENLENDPRFYS